MNSMTTDMSAIDEINNLSLIENGIVHLRFELTREKPSYFRIGREAHLIFCRAMIEALRGSDNSAVTTRFSKNRSVKCQLGSSPWKEIHKMAIDGCEEAWRFSEPQQCNPPDLTDGQKTRDAKSQEYLIGFYDALAMVQTECFMSRFVHSKPISVPDVKMKQLEWLHEGVRNEYEHFVPKFYMAPSEDLLDATECCLKLTDNVLFESNTVNCYPGSQQELRRMVQATVQRVSQLSKTRHDKDMQHHEPPDARQKSF